MQDIVKMSTRCVTGIPKGDSEQSKSNIIGNNENFKIDEDNPQIQETL